jgi:membrane protein YqaA with SNARE-associated domain
VSRGATTFERWAAPVWGFAEATFLFIVPDVLISIIAQRHGLRPALYTAGLAAIGAALGGVLMHWLGGACPERVFAMLDALPAISPDMIERARSALAEQPFRALLAGAFSGVPYKLFAAAAADAGISLTGFALLTLPARAARFVVAAVITLAVDRFVALWLGTAARVAILLSFWVVFYMVYWMVMPN